MKQIMMFSEQIRAKKKKKSKALCSVIHYNMGEVTLFNPIIMSSYKKENDLKRYDMHELELNYALI